MFLHQLSHVQKLAFLQIAIHITRADDNVDLSEIHVLSLMSREMSICLSEVMDTEFDIKDIKKMAKIFDTSFSKNVCLVELIGLAYADKSYHEKEKEIINFLQFDFGIQPEKVERMEEWVKKMANLYNDGLEIIGAG